MLRDVNKENGLTIDINSYNYQLPKDRIALYPANPRCSSKLLVLDRQKDQLEYRTFADIVSYLKPGDLIILNDSKVFPARLLGNRRGSGGKVELFLLRKLPSGKWEALVRPGKRIQPGSVVELAEGKLTANIGERTEVGGREIEFSANGDLMDLIWRFGEVPLPPYIARPAEENDKATYQTIYAKNIGAVAAPTAGFHFTDDLLNTIRAMDIGVEYVTLHPGLGTFRPITVSDATQHKMQEEYFSVPLKTADAINSAKAENRRVIAIGTTSVRTLESAFDESAGKVLTTEGAYTGKFIYPPYKFNVVNCLLTNFHLPKSTLLLLVSALAGREKVLAAYQEAVERNYRFYSYGDAMLII